MAVVSLSIETTRNRYQGKEIKEAVRREENPRNISNRFGHFCYSTSDACFPWCTIGQVQCEERCIHHSAEFSQQTGEVSCLLHSTDGTD